MITIRIIRTLSQTFNRCVELGDMKEVGAGSQSFPGQMVHNVPCLVTGLLAEKWPLAEYVQSPRGFENSQFVNDLGAKEICVHDVSKGFKTPMCIQQFATALRRGCSLYAKDWHLFQLCTSSLYSIPVEFMDDWLNWYWRRCKTNDDYRFVYIGGEHTLTYVHHDVICSYSWSINIQGRKRWFLWAPSDVPCLYSNDGELVSDARPGMYDMNTFPRIADTTPIVFEQDINEAVFVPSGWYHMVENLGSTCADDRISPSDVNITISLNHNWINGYNAYESWRFLLRELNLVRKEIWVFAPRCIQGHQLGGTCAPVATSDPLLLSECSADDSLLMTSSEWYKHCEVLLVANAAMSIVDYLQMICTRTYVLLYVFKFKWRKGLNSGDDLSVCVNLLRLLRVDLSAFRMGTNIAPTADSVETDDGVGRVIRQVDGCVFDEEDEMVLDYLCRYTVTAPPEHSEKFLSAVLEETRVGGGVDSETDSFNSKRPWQLGVPLNLKASLSEDKHRRSGSSNYYPMTGLQYVLREVMHILEEVVECELLLLHVAHSLQVDIRTEVASADEKTTCESDRDNDAIDVVMAAVETAIRDFIGVLAMFL